LSGIERNRFLRERRKGIAVEEMRGEREREREREKGFK